MKTKLAKTLSKTKKAYSLKEKMAFKKVKKKLKKMILTTLQQIAIDALLGFNAVCKNIPLSDFLAVWKAKRILMKLMDDHWNYKPPSGTYYSLTFFDDSGNTSDRTPRVNIGAFISKVSNAVRRMGLNAILVVEVQAIINHPGKGAGRTLCFHVHGIGWTDGPFDAKAEQKALNDGKAWNCSLGAEPVRITPIKDAPGEIGDVAAYILKSPNSGKNLMPSKKTPGKLLLMDTIKGYRGDLALRVFEARSQIPLTKAIFGVGSGTLIKKDLLKQLNEWHAERLRKFSGQGGLSGKVISPNYSIGQFWKTLRETNGSKLFQPFVFVEPAKAPSSKPKGPRIDKAREVAARKKHGSAMQRFLKMQKTESIDLRDLNDL